MPRPLLDDAHRSDAANEAILKLHPEVLDEVQDAIAKNDVVVIGMTVNTSVGRAKGALTKAGVLIRPANARGPFYYTTGDSPGAARA